VVEVDAGRRAVVGHDGIDRTPRGGQKYALLNPQLLIDYIFDDKSLWYVPEAQSAKILSLAPSIQVYYWYAAAPYSYTAYAKIYPDLATHLRGFKKL
jgi:hypothetical protein